MASRDADTAIWLNNKLGATDDRWSSVSICSQLTKEKLQGSIDCFHTLQPYVKIKFLLSLLHLPKRNVQEWKTELEEIIQMAMEDSEPWVSMVANILKVFPENGTLTTEVDERHNYFHELLADLRKTMKKMQDAGDVVPLECLYLSRNALQSIVGAQNQPTKHFALQRKPKSAELRADLLQKSIEAASSMKKGGISIPVKQRSFAKKMDDIGSLAKPSPGDRDKATVGFLKPSSVSSRIGSSTPLGNRTTNLKREGGIKLLELEEMPVVGKEAKRRRKAAEAEAAEQLKREKMAATVTPDYAASLMSPGLPAMTSIVIGGPSTSYFPGAVPIKPKQQPDAAGSVVVTVGGAGSNIVTIGNSMVRLPGMATILADAQKPGATGAAPVATATAPAEAVAGVQQQVTVVAAPIQPSQPVKGLSLTRDQMVEAQEMFKVSNKVTRPEKALILGFMAGSRDNPSPQQGDIINIRLSESLETVEQPDGTFRPMYMDIFFQMNYATGEWKRIKKFRDAIVE